MASSLSPHNLHLLFCCVLSLLALIWLVLMALFRAAIRRDSVSLYRFPFLSHVQVFSCEVLLISHLKRPQISFSSDFCFLVISVLVILVSLVLLPVVVISHFPCSLCEYRVNDASTKSLLLASPLPPTFLDIYSVNVISGMQGLMHGH